MQINSGRAQSRSKSRSVQVIVETPRGSRNKYKIDERTRRMKRINSSPDRLDLSAENSRLASAAGVRIAISTDAHSISEFSTIRYGIEQARRAGLEARSVLNCQSLAKLTELFKR